MAPTVNKNYIEAGEQITRNDEKWGSSTVGTSASITYGFRPVEQDLGIGYIFDGHDLDTRAAFNTFQNAQAVAALRTWSDLANITFTFAAPGTGIFPDNPDIYFSTYSDPNDGSQGYAKRPDSINGGDVWIDVAQEGSNPVTMRPDSNMPFGSYLYETLVHEIGHAIGLLHPGDYNAAPGVAITYEADAEYFQDSRQFSIMSYFDAQKTGAIHAGRSTAVPLLHDIAAVQRLYGANMTTRTTPDTYGFNSALGPVYSIASNTDQKIWAIWDAGGADTLDFSGYNMFQTITLEAAIADQPSADVKFSSVGGLIKNIVIAPGVVIESAIGGSSNDIITGNSVANILDAGNGADELYGGDGNDTLIGGAGADRIEGGAGNDIAVYMAPVGETVTLTATGAPADGTWTVAGPAQAAGDFLRGIEGFRFGTGGDQIMLAGTTGAGLVITLDGNDGNDIITGNAGSEIMIGGLGTDTLTTGAGRFEAYAGARGAAPGTWIESPVQNDRLIVDRTGYGADYSLMSAGAAIWNGTDTSIARGFTRIDYDGSAFRDRAQGGTGNDFLYGRGGTDILEGAGGLDYLDGGDGDDELQGGLGNDRLFGGTGFDYLSGGGGDDVIRTGGGGDTNVFGDAGDDVITGSGDREVIRGGTENDVIDASGGADDLHGDAGNDTLIGGEGDDFLDPGTGVETIDGGGGIDTLHVIRISETLGVTFFLNGPAGSDGTTAINIEKFVYSAGSGNDRVVGDTGNDILSGFAGRDTLEGGAGGDSISGGQGDDVLLGGLGFDVLAGEDGNDRIETGGGGDTQVWGGAGDDTLIGSADGELMQGGGDQDRLEGFAGIDRLYGDAGNDVLKGGLGNDTIDGGAGFDTADWSDATGGIVLTLGATGSGTTLDIAGTGIDAFANIENIVAGSGNDTLNGNALANTLGGGGGNDIINGGGGADRMEGGIGNDIYYIDNAGDVVAEAAGPANGYDTVRTTLAAFTLAANVERLYKDGTAAYAAIGNSANNTIYGNNGDDKFRDYNLGTDAFSGGNGQDSMFYTGTGAAVLNFATGVHGGSALGDAFASVENFFGSNTGGDTMTGGSGRAIFNGQGGNDALNGGANHDKLYGGAGLDTLSGGGGNDQLYGGAGNDTMTGGAARDYFVYTETAASGGWGADVLTDFQDGVDLLKFANVVANAFAAFTITGNATTTVLVALAAAPANTITLNGAAPITITAADFLFY